MASCGVKRSSGRIANGSGAGDHTPVTLGTRKKTAYTNKATGDDIIWGLKDQNLPPQLPIDQKRFHPGM